MRCFCFHPPPPLTLFLVSFPYLLFLFFLTEISRHYARLTTVMTGYALSDDPFLFGLYLGFSPLRRTKLRFDLFLRISLRFFASLYPLLVMLAWPILTLCGCRMFHISSALPAAQHISVRICITTRIIVHQTISFLVYF